MQVACGLCFYLTHGVASLKTRLNKMLALSTMLLFAVGLSVSAYATALKVGSTLMVLNLIASGAPLPDIELENPVEAVLEVSQEKNRNATLKRKSGESITALEIQEIYLDAVEQNFSQTNKEWTWIIQEWRRTLHELKHNPKKLSIQCILDLTQ